ncbi:MAG TPA: NAD(P)-dependent oxidoreductase [Candidatus Latescibacteria bacterium]|nr:NAD(P)-dependent oxidoreductase [Candidatus Handelsmanbacteria bacterium]HIL09470.1 NAD(P)-dependent oxidoreductase [Candidatus Latescibacterota bacterium]
MKVVVFGAAGWVGRAVLENLQKHHEVRAFDRGPESWQKAAPWSGGEIAHGDIADYDTVEGALDGVDAIIHAAVYAGSYDKDDLAPFQINLKGLWNVLEAARHRGINRIAHIGSCQVEHPQGIFFDADVRRPDGTLYAISKRLQEEMCRQFHDAFNQSIAVLRPCSIIDSRLNLAKGGGELAPGSWNTGMVCRHDLAEACRLAIEKDDLGFEVLHMAGAAEADEHCNTQHAREVLGFEFKGNLDQYR